MAVNYGKKQGNKMAVFRKKVLGELNGKVGEFVGKTRNGKHYIASVPSQYTMSDEPHEVDKRSRFKVNGKFAKAVRENELLYRIWEKEKAPASTAYNKICKVNFHLCGTDRPTAVNVITPEGFKLQVTDITPRPDGIDAAIEPFDVTDKEAAVIFIIIVSFYEPKIKGLEYYRLCSLNDYEIEGLQLRFKFDEEEKRIKEKYRNGTVFFAAVTVDGDGEVVRWSETTSLEI